MAGITVTILTGNLKMDQELIQELQLALDGTGVNKKDGISFEPGTRKKEWGQIVLVDSAFEGLEKILNSADRIGKVFILVLNQEDRSSRWLHEGKVDDVLLRPFRALEVYSMLRSYEHHLLWKEVGNINASLSGIVQNLKEDFELVERLQKAKLPKKFPSVKGFKVHSRYLAGLRSGGDYFDLAESKDGNTLSVVFSTASTYRLSGALLSALMRVTLNLSKNDAGVAGSISEIIQGIYEEVIRTVGDQGEFSLFYGMISLRDQSLRYMNLGALEAYVSAPFKATQATKRNTRGSGFQLLPKQGGALSQSNELSLAKALAAKEGEVPFSTDSRLALFSEGFTESSLNISSQLKKSDPTDLLNDLAFQIKGKLPDGELPPRDCSALIVDADQKVTRITPPLRTSRVVSGVKKQ